MEGRVGQLTREWERQCLKIAWIEEECRKYVEPFNQLLDEKGVLNRHKDANVTALKKQRTSTIRGGTAPAPASNLVSLLLMEQSVPPSMFAWCWGA